MSARLMRVEAKYGAEVWVFDSAFGPASEKSEEEREVSWNELSRCVEGRKEEGW